MGVVTRRFLERRENSKLLSLEDNSIGTNCVVTKIGMSAYNLLNVDLLIGNERIM